MWRYGLRFWWVGVKSSPEVMVMWYVGQERRSAEEGVGMGLALIIVIQVSAPF